MPRNGQTPLIQVQYLFDFSRSVSLSIYSVHSRQQCTPLPCHRLRTVPTVEMKLRDRHQPPWMPQIDKVETTDTTLVQSSIQEALRAPTTTQSPAGGQ